MNSTTFYFAWEPLLMEFLQSHLPGIGEQAAILFTMLGEELVMIAILGFVYWSYEKKFGIFIGTSLVVGLVWNPMLKNVVLRRRPYFDHEGIQCLKAVDGDADIYDIAAQGYSFPSGHSTDSAIVYGAMPLYKKKNPVLKVLGILLPLLVGISRVLLGVHYPTDVLCGWLMGGAILLGLSYLQRKVQNKPLMYLILFLVSTPGILYCQSDDYFTCLGIMAGFFLGNLFEEKYVHFENTRSIFFMILRVLGGMAIYVVLNTLLKMPFSSEFLASGVLAAHLVRTLRYGIIVFIMIGVYPMVFRKTGKTG